MTQQHLPYYFAYPSMIFVWHFSIPSFTRYWEKGVCMLLVYYKIATRFPPLPFLRDDSGFSGNNFAQISYRESYFLIQISDHIQPAKLEVPTNYLVVCLV